MTMMSNAVRCKDCSCIRATMSQSEAQALPVRFVSIHREGRDETPKMTNDLASDRARMCPITMLEIMDGVPWR